MNVDNKFNNILINSSKDDSDYSDNEYKNGDFENKKYEKFKQKNNNNNNNVLKRTESEVKDLLSFYIKNLENDNYSDIFYNEKRTSKKTKNSFKNKNEFNKKKVLRSNSLSIINNKNNNNKNTSPKHTLYHKNIHHKEKFNSNSNIVCVSKDKNANQNNQENHLQETNNHKSSQNSIIKEKIINLIEKTKSLSNKIWRKHASLENKIKNNFLINSNKSIKLNNISSKHLIKKHKSLNQDNNYLNFKNNFILNKKTNPFFLKQSLKKNKDIFGIFNKNKSDAFNDSNYNSSLSDVSNIKLNKKIFEIQNDNIYNNNDKNNIISPKIRKSSITNKSNYSNIKNSITYKELNNKNIVIKNSITHNNNISIFKKSTDKVSQKINNNCKRTETNINNKNSKYASTSKILRLDTNFKSLKEQIRKSIILRPEELDLSLMDEENDNTIFKVKENTGTNHIKKSNNKNNHNIIKVNKYKNKNTLGIENESSIIENKSNNNIDSTLLQEKRASQKIANIKGKKTIEKQISNNSGKRGCVLFYEKCRVLSHKPMIYDSLDDEEFEDEEEINNIYLEPNSTLNIIIDTILFIVTIYSLFEIPLYLAKNLNFCRREQITINSLINIFIEVLNILDFFLGFFRAYYNWEEQLITKHRMIAKNYLKTWFIIDLLASIPFYTINKLNEPLCNKKEVITENYNVILNNIHYLLMYNRLLKVLKVFRNNQGWKNISNKLNEYGINFHIIIYIFLIFSSINYTACIYIFIGRNSYPNWIFQTKLENASFINIYISAVYILIMAITTVGYGDITCYSLSEVIFQLLLLNIGIMAYSTVVSFLSNYIKKMNERSADFEKKISILDEIKINHPNFPDLLYDRILRHLKFKNFHEKKLKNIVFDCLPIGLKNNLISEMYKPIINNFIFFKNFQNTDLIVRVILAFKPIMAYKNDILVNEGDMVKDIMFVKKGILIVELPINMVNPQENIDKYIKDSILTIEKGPNVQKIGNSTIIPGKNPKMLKSIQTQNKSEGNSLLNVPTYFNNTFLLKNSPSFKNRITMIENEKKEREKMELQRKKNITFVKIVRIRENEHFGDVLMFLEQRSPLRVRVRTKKCEMLFLKKIDAIKISSSYQNIWKRINKKSIYNFEKIKENIKKIVEIYSSVKTINNNKEDILSHNNLKNMDKKTDQRINVDKENNNRNNSSFKIIKEKIDIKKNKTFRKPKINFIKFFKNTEKKDNLILKDINDIYHKHLSEKHLNKIFIDNTNKRKEEIPIKSHDSSYFSSLSANFKNKKKSKKIIISKKKEKKENKKNKFSQKLLDAFNGNYKFYKVVNQNVNNLNNNVTIISEKIDQEGTLHPLRCTNSIQKISTIKNNFISQKSMKKDQTIFKKNNISNFALIDNINKNSESESSYNKYINNELNSGEFIKVNKEENLLHKKVNFDFLSIKNNNIELKNSIDKKSKLHILLKSFGNEENIILKNKYMNNFKGSNINEKMDEKYYSSINGNISNNFEIKNNFVFNFRNNRNDKTNNNLLSLINDKIIQGNQRNWNSKSLSINNDISFKVDASYENLNLISKEKLIKNKFLQKKLKFFLLDEIHNLSENNDILLKKTNSLDRPTKYSIRLNHKSSRSIILNKIKKKSKNVSFLHRRSNTSSLSKIINRSSSFFEKLNSGINEIDQKILNNKIEKKKIVSQKGLLIQNMNTSNAFKIRRNSVEINPDIKSKKRNNNLLSKIAFNIQKTNQNLNNPDEFYSNYFNSLLKGEIVGIQNKKNDNFYQKSKTKKEKEKEKEKNQKNRK